MVVGVRADVDETLVVILPGVVRGIISTLDRRRSMNHQNDLMVMDIWIGGSVGPFDSVIRHFGIVFNIFNIEVVW